MTEDRLQAQLLDPKTRAKAFAQAVEMYSQRLYWLIRRTVRLHEDADDVLQETFAKAWQNIGSFRGEAKFYTWIYRIALFEAINHNKKRQRLSDKTLSVSGEMEYIVDNAEADPYFDGDRGEILLQQAIETLPKKQRQVFEMHYFDELPYKEIAQLTNTSEGALKASYHHAVKKIEQYLSDKD